MHSDYEHIISSLRALENGGGSLIDDLRHGGSRATTSIGMRIKEKERGIESRGGGGGGGGADTSFGARPRSNSQSNLFANSQASSISDENWQTDASTILKRLTAANVVGDGKNKSLSQLPLHEQEALASDLVKDISTNFSKSSHHDGIERDLPPHLAAFKKTFDKFKKNEAEGIKLPVIKVLSPRSQRKARLLPPPSQYEAEKLNKIEEKLKTLNKDAIYDFIKEKSEVEILKSKKFHMDDPIEQVVNQENMENGRNVAKAKSFQDQSTKKETIFEISAAYQQRIAKRDESLNAFYGEKAEVDKSSSSAHSLAGSGEVSIKSSRPGSQRGSTPNNKSFSKPLVIGNGNKKSLSEQYPFESDLKVYLTNHQEKLAKDSVSVVEIPKPEKKLVTEVAKVNAPTPYDKHTNYLRSNSASTNSKSRQNSQLQSSQGESGKAAQKVDSMLGIAGVRRRSLDSLSKSNLDVLGLFTPPSQTNTDISGIEDQELNTSDSGSENESNIAVLGSKNVPTLEVLVEESESAANSPCKPVTISPTRPKTVKSSTTKSPVRAVVEHVKSETIQASNSIPIEPTDEVIETYLPIVETTIAKAQEISSNFMSVRAEYSLALSKYQNLRHEDYMNEVKDSLYDEIGVDVDPQHTKSRLFGKSAKFLYFYVFATKIRTALRRWKKQVNKINVVRRQKAALLLSRVSRGMLVRVQLREALENIKRQREAEQLRKKAELSRQRWGRFIISRKLKIYVKWKVAKIREKRYFAARSIQKRIRGILGRKLAEIQRAWFNFRSGKSLKIQCAYRQHLARRRVILQKKLIYVKSYLEEFAKRQQALEKRNRERGAVWKIIKFYRQYLCRKKLRRLMYWRKIRLITFIQANIRRFVTFRKVGRMLVAERKRKALQNIAATAIQKIARGVIARRAVQAKKYRNYLARREKIQSKNEILARKPTLQQKIRRYFTAKIDDHTKAKMATKIQKIFRGWRGKKNALRQKISNMFENIRKVKLMRHKAAITIQRIARGHNSRKSMILRRKNKMALKIQCAFRIFVAKLRTAHQRAVKRSMLKIRNMLLRFIFVRRRLRQKKYWAKYGKYIVKIQKFWKLCIGRKFLNELKSSRRLEREINDAVELRINKILAGMQMKIIMDGFEKPITVNPSTFSSNACLCNGPIQSMFVLEAVHKGLVDPEALQTNYADGTSLYKFVKNVEGLSKEGKPDMELNQYFFKAKVKSKYDLTPSQVKKSESSKSESKKAKDKKKDKSKSTKRSLPYSLLFDYLKKGLISLYQFNNKISAVDCDMLFNLVKKEGEMAINYDEFCKFLRELAKIHSQKPIEKPKSSQSRNSFMRKDSPSKQQRPSELDTDLDYKDNNEPISTKDSSSPSNFEKFNSESEFAVCIPENTKQKKYRDFLATLIYPTDKIFENKIVSFILRCLLSFLKENWMIDVINFIEYESRTKLDSFLIKIQCMIRCRLARKAMRKKIEILNAKRKQLEHMNKILKCQAFFRQVLAKWNVARKAQRILMKYIPFEGKSYWYNPVIKISTYTKPKVLGKFECKTVPLPPLGLEYVVKCSNCPSAAFCNCIQCEDSLCKLCFQNLHSKGSRKSHKYNRILMCPYCQVQMVTKFCDSCMVRKPQLGSIQELLSGSERGLYCDSCFIHSHSGFEKHLECSDVKVKIAKRTLLYSTKDAYLVGHEIHQKLVTNHKFEFVVTPCEECKWRCAAWRCKECVQIYCNTCLLGLHSNGGPFSKHKAEKLPYYTEEMCENYERDFSKQMMQKKMAKMARSETKRKEILFLKSVLLVQTWWRKVYWGGIGKKLIKMNRRRLRRQALLYKSETLTIRNTVEYKAKQYSGRAPPLLSDTKRDTVLRHISSINYDFADYFILKNKSEEGYVRTKKGVPKTGYDVGTVEELIDQATFGGFRMPGRVSCIYGRSMVHTTFDLSTLLNVGEMVRISQQLFRIVRCEKTKLILSRKWRGNNAENLLLYRVPTYSNEKYVDKYKWQYWAYDACIAKNFLSIAALNIHHRIYSRLSNMSVNFMKDAAKADNIPEAIHWRSKAAKYFKQSMWSLNFLGGSDVNIDLSTAIDPEELKKQSESEKRDQQIAKAARKKNNAAKRLAKEIESNMLQSAFGDESMPAFTEISSVEEDSTIKLDKNTTIKDKDDDDISVLTVDTHLDEKHKSSSPSKLSAIHEVKSSSSSVISDSTANKFLKLPPKPVVKRPPGVDWYATREEIEWRKSREFLMTRDELASEAHEWEQCIDPLTEVIFYRHIPTFEITADVPRAVAAHREITEEKERNLKNYEDANRRIKILASAKEKRIMINGRKK